VAELLKNYINTYSNTQKITMGFFSVWVWVLGRRYLERENFNYEKEAW